MNTMLGLLNLGGGEIILILATVLILFGAKKLPELAKGLGQGIKEFKKATNHASEEPREAMVVSPQSGPKRLAPAANASTDLESVGLHARLAQQLDSPLGAYPKSEKHTLSCE